MIILNAIKTLSTIMTFSEKVLLLLVVFLAILPSTPYKKFNRHTADYLMIHRIN
jgi:hypothetical protein